MKHVLKDVSSPLPMAPSEQPHSAHPRHGHLLERDDESPNGGIKTDGKLVKMSMDENRMLKKLKITGWFEYLSVRSFYLCEPKENGHRDKYDMLATND